MLVDSRPNSEGPTFRDYYAASVLLGRSEDYDVSANAESPPSRNAAAGENAGGRELTEIVLSAVDEDDLAQALDEALDSPVFLRQWEAVVRLSARDVFQRIPTGPSAAAVMARQQVLGPEATKLLAEADQLRIAFLMASTELIARAAEGQPAASASTPSREPLAFLVDPGFPTSLKETLVEAWRGMIALAALRTVVRERHQIPQWLAIGLAKFEVEGIRAALRSVDCARPGVVDERLLKGKRFDAVAEFGKAERTQAYVSKSAEKSGDAGASAKD